VARKDDLGAGPDDSTARSVVRSVSILLFVSAAVSFGGCGQAGESGIQAGIEQIASISDEGSLLAEGVARTRTKTTFVRVHGAELSAQAEHEAEKLSDAPASPGLKGSIQAAIELAAEISSAIEAVRVSPHDRLRARVSEANLRRWARRAATLAETL
jgi:hypothetical protein